MPIPPLLTIAELRAYCRAEEDPAQDAELLAMAAAAERHVESLTGQVLTRRTEILRDREWPEAGWDLVRYPVLQVLGITYTDPAGAVRQLPELVWVVESGPRSLVRLRTGQQWPEILPDSEIILSLDVGYPSGLCPPPLKLACQHLAAHWFDNRGAVSVAASVTEIPKTFDALIAPYRLSLIG